MADHAQGAKQKEHPQQGKKPKNVAFAEVKDNDRVRNAASAVASLRFAAKTAAQTKVTTIEDVAGVADDVYVAATGAMRKEVPMTIQRARRDALLRQPSERSEQDLSLVDQLLDSCKFAITLKPEMRSRLCRLANYMSKAEGDVIFRQGDEGDFFYLVLSGSVRVLVDTSQDSPNTSPRGRGAAPSSEDLSRMSPEATAVLAKRESRHSTREVAILHPGDAFGELALVSADAKRSATVVCTSPCELMVLRRDAYQSTLAGSIGSVATRYVKEMQSCTLLQDEDLSILQEVAHILITQTLVRRTLIYKQYSMADRIYIVTKGQVSLVRYVNVTCDLVHKTRDNLTDRTLGMVSADRIASTRRVNRAPIARTDMHSERIASAAALKLNPNHFEHMARAASAKREELRRSDSIKVTGSRPSGRNVFGKNTSEYLAYRPLTNAELYRLGDFGVNGHVLNKGAVSARRASDKTFQALKNPFVNELTSKVQGDIIETHTASLLKKINKSATPVAMDKKSEREKMLKKIEKVSTMKKDRTEILSHWNAGKMKVKAALAFRTDYLDDVERRKKSFVEVDRMQRHEIFGYVEVIQGTRRMTSASTHEPTELLTLAAWDFLRRFSPRIIARLEQMCHDDDIIYMWSHAWDEKLCDTLSSGANWDTYAIKEKHRVETERDHDRWLKKPFRNFRNAGGKEQDNFIRNIVNDHDKLNEVCD